MGGGQLVCLTRGVLSNTRIWVRVNLLPLPLPFVIKSKLLVSKLCFISRLLPLPPGRYQARLSSPLFLMQIIFPLELHAMSISVPPSVLVFGLVLYTILSSVAQSLSLVLPPLMFGPILDKREDIYINDHCGINTLATFLERTRDLTTN